MESKYLARFSKVPLPLRGNRIIVEVVPQEEIKTAGGIIVASDSSYKGTAADLKPCLAIVLACGPGYYDDETGADVNMDITPGQVVLVSEVGLKKYSQFPGLKDYTRDTIALTRDSEVHIRWNSIADYLAYSAALNAE